jgi:hypothetical protein
MVEPEPEPEPEIVEPEPTPEGLLHAHLALWLEDLPLFPGHRLEADFVWEPQGEWGGDWLSQDGPILASGTVGYYFGDFNADGQVDLLVASLGDPCISEWYGHEGTLLAVSIFGVEGGSVLELASRDLNCFAPSPSVAESVSVFVYLLDGVHRFGFDRTWYSGLICANGGGGGMTIYGLSALGVEVLVEIEVDPGSSVLATPDRGTGLGFREVDWEVEADWALFNPEIVGIAAIGFTHLGSGTFIPCPTPQGEPARAWFEFPVPMAGDVDQIGRSRW